MDLPRFILVVCFVLVTMKLWTDWEMTYGLQQDTSSAPAVERQPSAAETGEIPTLIEDTKPGIVPLHTPTDQQDEAALSSLVEVLTDTHHLKIDLRGAGINHAWLLQYPTAVDKPDDPFVLLDDSLPDVYVAQGGLLSGRAAPTHEALFQSARNNYSLAPGEDVLRVPFFWSGNGLSVTKTYELQRGSHLIKVVYRIENRSDEAWRGRSYSQFKRADPDHGGMRLLYTYTGAVISSPEKRYEKISFSDMADPLDRETQNGWIAMIQHYFVTALIPVHKDLAYRYYTRFIGNNLFTVGAITPAIEIPPGETGEISELIYVGPKVQSILAGIADGLDLTVDYGFLWFIAKPLFWCLSKIHDWTGNWGWSIILLTILLKILFYKLSAAGYRSMANMRRVQPRIMSIRDRYKNDKARLNQAMMQIYKEEKINPLGGCFPILIQIPVFIALYWVLLESVEMRQASFIFWWRDLSTPDPYWVLPVIMGITMYIQQKLNPAPIDPVQAKVMSVLPFVFTIFFGFFPSGLVLYWVANNTLSIGQQWLIMRNLERAGPGTSSR